MQISEVESRPEVISASWLARQKAYGWLTILIGAAAMACTYPGRTHGLGMVTEPLLKDFGLNDPDGRVLFASLNLWGTLLGAAFCLPIGWLFDRFDRRWVLAGNLVLLGGSVYWMSTVESWQALLAALILTRGLGQSALSVVSITIVAKSFRAQQLGLAMAWYAVLSIPFHLILIKAVGWALKDGGYDWRAIWAGVGVALIGMSLLAALLVRGIVTAKDDELDRVEPGATFREALATPAFWAFSLTISLWGMIYSGVALFNEDIFKERGFSRDLYFDVLMLVTIVALASKFLFGWLTRFVPLTRLLSACLVMTAFSLAGLPLSTEIWHVYLYGIAMGIASGAVALLFFATWGRLYGRRELGRIQGVAQMLTVLASAGGPLVFSLGKRSGGSYAAVFTTLSSLVAVMAIAVWFVPLPKFQSSMENSS